MLSNKFFFSMCMTSRYDQEDWSSNNEALRKYFVLPNYESNKNQETSVYQIANQTQCHHTPTLHHIIPHAKEASVQYSFQLCQQGSPFYSFWTCNQLARTTGDSKKNILLLFVNMNTLLFSIQYEHVSFPCVLQPKTIS